MREPDVQDDDTDGGSADEKAQDDAAELKRLRAENDALRTELASAPVDTAEHRVARSHRRRAVTSIVFVVLGALLLPLAAATVWTRNQLLDTDRYVRTVEPLAEDPTVTSALSARITSTVVKEVDVKSLAEEALPERAAFLAAPIASGAESLIRQASDRIVASEQFRTLWTQANRRGHDAMVAVLTGEGGKAVSTKDGKVVISLGPVIEEVLKAVDRQFGIDISSRIPTDRIDIDFEIIDSRQLASAQTYVRLLDRISWFSVLLALGLLAAAVAIAPDRRKGVFRVGVGVAVSMLLTLIALAFARDIYLTNLPAAVQRADAAAVIYDTLLRFFIQSLRVLLAIGVVLLVAAWLCGPSAAARRLRGWWDTLLGRGSSGLGGSVELGPVPRFVAHHVVAFRVAILAIAALVLVTWNLPTGKVVVLIALCTLVPLAVVQLLAGVGDNAAAAEGADGTAPTTEPVTGADATG